jgi:hypothetical protein
MSVQQYKFEMFELAKRFVKAKFAHTQIFHDLSDTEQHNVVGLLNRNHGTLICSKGKVSFVSQQPAIGL